MNLLNTKNHFFLAVLLFCISAAISTEALSRPMHYGAVDYESVQECDDLQWTGQLAAAQSCYENLLNNDSAIAVQAEAAWALGDVQAANNLFERASAAETDSAVQSRIMSRWGDLFLNTYQYQDALDLYVQASELSKQNYHATLGVSLALHESSDPIAQEQLATFLEQNNGSEKDLLGARLSALLTLAFIHIRADNLDLADRALTEAEEAATDGGYPLMEVYAHYAAYAIRDRADPTSFIDQALAINPHYGDAYAIPAFIYIITFKYDQAGDFYQKAVDVQPDHFESHLELAANHLRQNRSSLAREHFTIAYDGDPFKPEAVNSMRLMDTYDSLDVLNFPAASSQLIPDLSLRLDKKERDQLAPYVSGLALKAIETFEDRYQFKLKETAHIEIYPNHDDFIVRALGMPGVPLLGVAFGYLVAMDSPSAKAGGDYHWGTTLWHEVAHIFTIKASEHNVPRWFSEGVSVFEEWQTGPLAIDSQYARVPISVYRSLIEHEFLSIKDLDDGFVRPKYDNQVIVSYNQAGLICDFIVNQFGFDQLVAMLNGYAQELNTLEIIESVLELSPEQFDQQFNDYFDDRYGDNLTNLEAWAEQMETVSKAAAEENWQEVINAADKAIALMPDYSDLDSPYLIKARAYRELEDSTQQFAVLERFWQAGGYAPNALKELANHYADNDQEQQAIAVFNDVNLVDPFDLNVHLALGDLLLNSQQARLALSEYKVAMALEPLDKADVFYRIGNAYQTLGETDLAKTQALTALEIAPHFRPAQKLLMETLSPSTEP